MSGAPRRQELEGQCAGTEKNALKLRFKYLLLYSFQDR
jgi:hypothetical protein